MALAQTAMFSTRLKLESPLPLMLANNNFLKWTEPSNSSEKSSPVFVTLRTDPKGFIIYWRDWNKINRLLLTA
ncbi:hypothetical protein BpHYR1_029113 [Brachionus plicatilis]|uniref:Uncharacterized protein n=1 Tax=Brachionus plicatilis TaxID=10195 RepID=A0A3M7QUL9_BRAPC|nr:hypothetical protein BpHYR1_029113 [Brachionus plicatilis]